ncbi:putative tRNA-splicing endonuclease subunit Sen2-like [Scophthalmus maximus]|uniref:tRNA-splicing endonuclease subunit Sen2 n=1 Tax=Scophthalmus maximus TaxID=52904 RepID=A0A2U9BFF2_SCOMX|nr:putative tRNA-splicing endonuclease subunit Sen2-like [Scophthalmus maximus]
MQAEFRAPRRRTRVHEAYEAPLPVGRSPGERAEFRAELINQHVLVCHRDHIQKIHNQGYFGKGILSRARPDHSISDKWEEHKGLFLPVVSQSRYEEMLRWAEAALVAQGLDGEAVSQILSSISQPVEMEDVRREVAGGKNGHRGEEGPGPEGGVCLGTKRQRSEVEPEAKRSCSSDSDPNLDPDPDPSSDSDPDPEPLVPGSGFVLVVRDSEVGDGVRGVRTTPFSLSEYLQLSPEEAFFLVYSLGCLSVYLHQEPLTIIQLWRKFRSLNPDFVTSYAAYHHFRSRGWVPKGGAKYGVDLMLYRKGPPFYHSSYSVVIEQVDDTFRGSALRPFSWRSLATLNRITASVSKELMLCYIIHPTDLTAAELDSPECLSRLKVQEVIASRWVSSKERAEQEDI